MCMDYGEEIRKYCFKNLLQVNKSLFYFDGYDDYSKEAPCRRNDNLNILRHSRSKLEMIDYLTSTILSLRYLFISRSLSNYAYYMI